MRKRVRLWARTGLILLAVGTIPLIPIPIQGQNFPGPVMNATGGGQAIFDGSLPPPPPQGAWGEVIYSNAQWLVIQNHSGQQFPVAYSSVSANNFLIRWPMRRSDLSAQSRVEAIGMNQGSNICQTDHVDVFEGVERDMLTAPRYNSILPGTRAGTVTAIDPGYFRQWLSFDLGAQASLYGWAYPVPPVTGDPAQLHVVGSPISRTPLVLQAPGYLNVTVLPAPGNELSITQVTFGTPSLVQKGDIAFLVPSNVTPRTLVLSQLVVLKKVPRNQYTP